MSVLRNHAGASLLALVRASSSPACAETVAPVFKHELPSAVGKAFTVVEVNSAAGTEASPHRHGQAFVTTASFPALSAANSRGSRRGPAALERAGSSRPEPTIC